VPPPVEQSRTALWVVGLAVAAAMLGAIVVWLTRKRREHPPTSARGHPTDGREPSMAAPLIAQLATLDARFERAGSPSADQREQYERERTALKQRIEHALAAENTPP